MTRYLLPYTIVITLACAVASKVSLERTYVDTYWESAEAAVGQKVK